MIFKSIFKCVCVVFERTCPYFVGSLVGVKKLSTFNCLIFIKSDFIMDKKSIC